MQQFSATTNLVQFWWRFLAIVSTLYYFPIPLAQIHSSSPHATPSFPSSMTMVIIFLKYIFMSGYSFFFLSLVLPKFPSSFVWIIARVSNWSPYFQISLLHSILLTASKLIVPKLCSGNILQWLLTACSTESKPFHKILEAHRF